MPDVPENIQPFKDIFMKTLHIQSQLLVKENDKKKKSTVMVYSSKANIKTTKVKAAGSF